jgi:hypothetical protein
MLLPGLTYPYGEDRGVTEAGAGASDFQAASLVAGVFQFQGNSWSSFWML